MGSVRASPRAVLIAAVGLTQWLARACRTRGRCSVQRRLRVRGGQRHVVADARRGAPGGSRGERRTASPVRPRAASSSAATRAVCGRWPTCSAPPSARPACRRDTRSRARRVRAARHSRAPGSSATAAPRSWPGAGCAAAPADARWQAASATLPSRCDCARRRHRQPRDLCAIRLDARRRARQRASRARGGRPTLVRP